MNNKKIDSSFIDDIFGIPQDGSNLTEDESEAYTDLGKTATKVPFDAKVAEITSDIVKAAGKVMTVVEKAAEKHQTKKEPVTPIEKKDDVEAAIRKAVPVDPTSTTSMFGDIFGDEDTKAESPKTEKKEKDEDIEGGAVAIVMVTPKNPVPILDIAKEEPKVETKVSKPAPKKSEDKVDDSGIIAQTQPSKVSAPLIIGGKATIHKWRLDSPSPKYNRFYEAKREALQDALLKGGELPFDQYYNELENANVDVTVGETFQAELVCGKMSECQKHRERIKQIQLRVNRQFFQWERHMDLFEGLLSRIEYERGKQEGVKYEHMYDMESYFGELKSLHKSIDNVMRVLDSAFECLSRQVTVTMPMKDVERYSTGPKPLSPTLQGYDGLKKTHANGSPSIGTSRPTIAGTPAETTAKSGWGIVD